MAEYDNSTQRRKIDVLNEWNTLKGREPLTEDGFCNGDASLFALLTHRGQREAFNSASNKLCKSTGAQLAVMEDKHDEYQAHLNYIREQPETKEALDVFHKKYPSHSRDPNKYTDQYIDELRIARNEFLMLSEHVEQIQFLFQPENFLSGFEQNTYARNMNFLAGNTFPNNENASEDTILCAEKDKLESQFQFSYVYNNSSEISHVLKEIAKNATEDKIIMVSTASHAMSINYNAADGIFDFKDSNQNEPFKTKNIDVITKYLYDNQGKKSAPDALKTIPISFSVVDRVENKMGLIDKNKLILDIEKNRAEVSFEQKVENMREQMFIAIKCNDFDTVECLLTQCEGKDDLKNAVLNSTERKQTASPIIYASALGRMDTMDMLVAHGANVNYPGVFSIAVEREQTNVIKYLLAHGIDTEHVDIDTEMRVAAKNQSNEILQILCEIKYPIVEDGVLSSIQDLEKMEDETLSILLSHMARYNNLKGAEYLVNQQGVMPSQQTLVNAMPSEDIKIFKLIFESGNFQENKALIQQLLHLALRQNSGKTEIPNSYELSKYLIDNGGTLELSPEDTDRLAVLAAQHNDLELLKQINHSDGIDNDDPIAFILAELNDMNNTGRNLDAIKSAAENNHFDIVQYLVEDQHVSIEPDIIAQVTKDACRTGNTEMLEYFIAQQADLNQANMAGSNSLNIAVASGNLSVVEILVNGGANLNYPDQNGNTPLIQAAKSQNQHIIEYLINSGVKNMGLEFTTGSIQGFDVNVNALQQKLNRQETNAFIQTWQQCAQTNGKLEQCKDMRGQTPIMWAVQLEDMKSVQSLLSNLTEQEKSMMLNMCDKSGISALDMAVASNYPKLAQMLLNNGATVTAESKATMKNMTKQGEPMGQMQKLFQQHEKPAIQAKYVARQPVMSHSFAHQVKKKKGMPQRPQKEQQLDRPKRNDRKNNRV